MEEDKNRLQGVVSFSTNDQQNRDPSHSFILNKSPKRYLRLPIAKVQEVVGLPCV